MSMIRWKMRARFFRQLINAVRQFEKRVWDVGLRRCECGNVPDVDFAVGTRTPAFILYCRDCSETTIVERSASEAIDSWNRERDILNAEIVR
jgi:hypothetical protein